MTVRFPAEVRDAGGTPHLTSNGTWTYCGERIIELPPVTVRGKEFCHACRNDRRNHTRTQSQ